MIKPVISRSTLGLLYMLASLLVACSERTAEEKLKDFNTTLAPEGQFSAAKDLTLHWPEVLNDRRERINEPVALLIPSKFHPEPILEWPKTPVTRIETVIVNIEIEGMKPWKELPPIPSEVYDGPRLYSALDTKPDSMANPKTRAKFENWRALQRSHKRVQILRNRSYATQEQQDKYFPFKIYQLNEPTEPPDYGTYLIDGEVGGLQRFSMLHCYPSFQHADPLYKNILAHKAQDDPSPPGCVVNRSNARYVSKRGTDLRDWVYLECEPVLLQCRAHFQAGQRAVEVRLWAHDLPRWRETVDPIRLAINNFVILQSNPK